MSRRPIDPTWSIHGDCAADGCDQPGLVIAEGRPWCADHWRTATPTDCEGQASLFDAKESNA